MREPSEREEAIFEAALERKDLEDQAAYVRQACGEDAQLHQSVCSLLRAYQNAGVFLEQAPAVLQSSPSNERDPLARSAPALTSEQPGDRIGRYRLLQKIGEGGCGIVYMAEQEEPVQRRVALKIIKVGMDTRQVIARFEAERQALALMDHPNIARVLDAGATDTGRPFFVMELVRGIRITEYCDQNNLSTRERLALFQQVCHAIQHAHQKGIVHRDIKPSNILVTLQDGVPVPVIIDFGIAKATERRLTDKTLFTAFEQFIGTPAYMSPEQAEMSRLDVDTRSDIYSLGVLLYELLTGHTPFDAQTLMEAGLDQMRRTIREKEPVRPSTRLSTLLAADLSAVAKHRQSEPLRLIHMLRGDLDWIAMKCLEKDRTRRYETANGLAQDVQRYLQNEPVSARPPSTWYRVQKMVRRNKVACAAGAAVALALIIGLAVSTWLFLLEKEAYRRASLAERNQSRLRLDAERARVSEAQQHRAAEENAQLSRFNSYAADVSSAFLALRSGNLGRATDLLERQAPRPGESDLRGFAWRLLWQEARGDELYSLPHPGLVSCALFAPDGQSLFTAAYDGLVRRWDLSSRQVTQTTPGFERQAGWHYISLSSDGRWLAGVRSGKLSVLDVREKDWPLHSEQTSQARVVSFTPDGGSLLAWGNSGLTVVDTQTWQAQELRTKLEPGAYPCLASDRPGKSVALAHEGSASIEIWDLETRMRSHLFPVPTEPGMGLVSLAWSPDGRLAGGTWSGKLLLLDSRTGEVLSSTTAHAGSIFGLTFSPDAQTLVTAGHDQLIHFWSVPKLERLQTLHGHRDEIWSLDYSADGRLLCTAGKDGTAKVWSPRPKPPTTYVTNWFARAFTRDGRSLLTITEPSSDLALDYWDVENPGVRSSRTLPVQDLSSLTREVLSPDARLLGVAKEDGRIEVWSCDSGRLLSRVLLAQNRPSSMLFAEQSTTLVVGTEQGSIDLWDYQSGQVRRIGRPGSGRIAAIRQLAGNRFLRVTQEGRATDSVWDVTAGTELPLPANAGDKFQISPDGRTLALSGTNYSVRVLTLPSLRERAVLNGHRWTVYALAFSADGKLLATGGLDAVARVWNAETGAEFTRPLRGHFQGVTGLAFSPDGKILATGSTDNTVKVWHLATGRELFSLEDAKEPSFSPDGNTLMFETTHGLRLLHVPTLQEIDLARRAETNDG